MKFSVVITSFKEPASIKKAIESVLRPNLDLKDDMELIVVAPDQETLTSAREKIGEFPFFSNFLIVQDNAEGKPAALNLAFSKIKTGIVILTDGDMYISENSIKDLLTHFESSKVGGVSGHPVSLDDRNTQFGYYSHLFCEAAHKRRLVDKTIAMSGYLYAFRNIEKLFPLPEEIRAEDAYISAKILEAGYTIEYEPNALAHVHFPKNLNDWLKQKKRSLGGNVQISANTPHESRNISQDLKEVLFPVNFASSPKEYLYSAALYPIRLYLWASIYLQHSSNSYSKGQWERIESSKH